jgi:mannitol-specific phosphotransferase system IIBC component
MTENHVTDEHAHDHAHEHGPRDADESRLSPRLSRGIAATLAAVAALALVAIVVELVVLRPRYQEARADERARTEVAQVAEQFAVQVNNYDTGSIDDYQETVRSLLTTKFAGEFEKAMGDIVTSVNEAQMSSQGKVLTSAVASVDPDSAEVLVVADANVKTVFDTRARHFRWEVSLVKVDGTWLVDNFTPVT